MFQGKRILPFYGPELPVTRKLTCDQQQAEKRIKCHDKCLFLVQGLLLHAFHMEPRRWLSSVFPHNSAKAEPRLLHRSHCTMHCALVGRPGAQKISMVLLSKHTNTGHCPDLATILVKSGTLA